MHSSGGIYACLPTFLFFLLCLIFPVQGHTALMHASKKKPHFFLCNSIQNHTIYSPGRNSIYKALSLSNIYKHWADATFSFSGSVIILVASFSLKLLDPMSAMLSSRGALQEKCVSINCSHGERHLRRALLPSNIQREFSSWITRQKCNIAFPACFGRIWKPCSLSWPSECVGSDDEAWLIVCGYQRRQGCWMTRALRSGATVRMLSGARDSFHVCSTGYYICLFVSFCPYVILPTLWSKHNLQSWKFWVGLHWSILPK